MTFKTELGEDIFKENGAMKKVGEVWDWENKICGEYRYRDI